MGTADIIPGVSGGTMAFILGIYERLLQALKAINLTALKLLLTLQLKSLLRHIDWKLLFGLAIGIIGAIFFFTHIISLPNLLQLHKARVYAFFFGLVFATVILLIWRYQNSRFTYLALLAAGTIAGYMLISMEMTKLPYSYGSIFISGMLAICAMLLPGISGSYILLILGMYDIILSAVSQHIWEIVAVFITGACVGMLLFIRLLTALLKKFHDATMFFISGLVIGTLPMLWPMQYITDNSVTEFQWIVGMILSGIASILVIFILQKQVAG